MKTAINRRRFLSGSAKTGAGLLILANSKLAFSYEANSKLNIAGIGVGGQGRGSLDTFHRLGNNLVALCDVDSKRAGDIYQKHPGAKRYEDFRQMFDEMEKQIDAVLVATPDHTHAVAAVAAMKLGKHVYCEKPLTRTVREARVMRETAAQHKVVTQMGNQGSAENRLRRAVELIWGGVIGDVREAHVWFDGGNGPMKRPPETPVPDGLNWDLWLGPAEYRPYSSAYVPGSWRSWRAFGSGIVGDFACHTANIMFRALHLEQLWQKQANPGADKLVIRVQAWPSERDPEGYPASSRITMDIPARGKLPPVKSTWYAKEKPSEDLLLGFPRAGWGDLLVGTKGSLYSENPWNMGYVLLPEERFEGFKSGPPETLPRVQSHQWEWIEACKGNGKTFSSFDIGGPLTELAQLANLATLVEGPIEYDTLSGEILNSPEASRFLHREYRKGWSI
jgi:hypothetical protein